MTSNQSHQALVFGSISIDKIINRYGTYDNVLGGSASYALLATKSKECQLVGMVGSDFPKNHFNLLGDHSINLDDLKIEEGKTFCWGGEYAHEFSSRETLYVDPGVSEKYQPILSENDSWNNPPRAVAFNYGKHIPEVSSMEPGTFLIKKDERTERYTQKYCETVMRYTCRSCAGSLIANRQQILLSNNRIRWLPLNEYYDLRNFTYTEEPGSRVDKYGFEYSYSIIFACYQTMTKKLLRKIRRKRFPITQCFDSEIC